MTRQRAGWFTRVERSLLSRVLSSLVFEISPRDPITYAALAGLRMD